MTFTNQTQYVILQCGKWFMVIGDNRDTEIKTKSLETFAQQISEKEEIMEAYNEGSIEFDESISSEIKEEIDDLIQSFKLSDSIISDLTD